MCGSLASKTIFFLVPKPRSQGLFPGLGGKDPGNEVARTCKQTFSLKDSKS